MRSMRINVAQFVKEYHEAVAADLTTTEFAKLLGIHATTLYSRVRQCQKRGIKLPLLKDQKTLRNRKEAAAQRREEKANRKAEREARRALCETVTSPMPRASSTPSVDIEALSDRVADKVYDRLRDTLRFQFFVGPEIPA